MPTPARLELNASLSSEKIAIYCQEQGCELLTKPCLEALFSRLQSKQAKLSRLKQLGSELTEQDVSLLEELQFSLPLVGALASNATSSPGSVHDLLAQCDMSEENEVVSKIAVTVWVNRLQDLLAGEAYPLAL